MFPTRAFRFVALSLGLLSAGLTEAAPRTVVLIRHAETVSDGSRDRGLSEAGRARAQALAAALEHARVSAVITSRYLRTRDTGAPTAALFGLETVAVALTREGGLKGHIAAVVAAVKSAPDGVVLVVGHANTVPAVTEALGGPALPHLAEDDYSTLFTLLPGADGKVSLLRSELPATHPDPQEALRKE